MHYNLLKIEFYDWILNKNINNYFTIIYISFYKYQFIKAFQWITTTWINISNINSFEILYCSIFIQVVSDLAIPSDISLIDSSDWFNRLLEISFRKTVNSNYWELNDATIDSIFVSEKFSAVAVVMKLPNIDIPYLNGSEISTKYEQNIHVFSSIFNYGSRTPVKNIL